MEDAEQARSLVAVTNLREFFHDSMQTALRHQKVAVDDHTEHYVVNVLTMFARSDELYEKTPEGVRLKPLAHMLAEASEASSSQQRDSALRRLGAGLADRQLPTGLGHTSTLLEGSALRLDGRAPPFRGQHQPHGDGADRDEHGDELLHLRRRTEDERG